MNEKFSKGFRGETEEDAINTDTQAMATDMPAEGAEMNAEVEANAEMPAPEVDAPVEATPTEGPIEDLMPAVSPIEPEMTQSEKSWEGRLRAREAELKAKAAELEAKSAEIESAAPISYDEAVAALTQDFGEDFVKMIQVVASKNAQAGVDIPVAELRTRIDDITNGVQMAFNQVHNNLISTVHEDFEEIASSDKFMEYIDGLEAQEKAEAMTIIERGTPRQVVKLLSAFKKTLTSEGDDSARYDTSALDAAAGVRSAGGRAPSFGGDKVAAGSEIDRFRAGFGS